MPNKSRPLDGIRVLDLTQNVGGPLAGQVLADIGAEVIKLEAPGGEAARRITTRVHGRDFTPYFAPYNRGKRSVVLDIRTPQGREGALSLVDAADVWMEGFRPGVLRKLGLAHDVIQKRNPRCICASLTAYGGCGAASQRPGVDMLLQAETGLITGLRRDNGMPQLIASTIVDGASGHVLAQAILAALIHRDRHSIAERISVSLYDVACSLQANFLTFQLSRNLAQDSAHPKSAKRSPASRIATAPSGVFKASDEYFVISAYVQKHWLILTQVLRRPDLATDARFIDQRTRADHADDLSGILNAVFASRTAMEWVAQLRDAGLMATLVHPWTEVIQSEVFVENQLAVTTGNAEGRETTIRTPARYATFDATNLNSPPELGESTEHLIELKYLHQSLHSDTQAQAE
jgi:crotonobetainyl-CoA:carnitine CoA-transferase CaiB-like acyl-CoA transferase